MWLVTSCSSVERWYNSIVRGATFGLHVEQIPCHQSGLSADAFHSPVFISLQRKINEVSKCSSRPEKLKRLRDRAVRFLLLYNGFVHDWPLPAAQAPVGDNERRQLMHESGCALVREVEDGFIWIRGLVPQSNPDGGATLGKFFFQRFLAFCEALLVS